MYYIKVSSSLFVLILPCLTFQACTTCSKTFSNASALAKHRLTHSEERKYHCNQCSKAFKRQDHLNGHLLTHRDGGDYYDNNPLISSPNYAGPFGEN